MFEVDPGQKIFHSAPNFDSTGPRFFEGPQPLLTTKTGVTAPNCPFFCRIYSKSGISILADSK
jgi:hypothetical protein